MQFKVFKLKFKNFTHFGETGIDLENVSEWVGSDTLFSAWLNTISAFYGTKKASEICQKFLEIPEKVPFRISSLFVYYQDFYFLPKPLSTYPKGDPSLFKIFKKINWISLHLYDKWLVREVPESVIEDTYQIQKKYQEAYKKIIRPRVSLDRKSMESNLFHEGYIKYKENAGLWGVVVGSKEGVEVFMKGLKLLGELGLGGERTYGSGLFEVKKVENKIETYLEKLINSRSPWKVLISRCIPSKKEIESLKDCLEAYKIGVSRGWICSGRMTFSFKRKSIIFLKEGSVLKKSLSGDLVDVTPEIGNLPHKIYRYGLALTIPFQE